MRLGTFSGHVIDSFYQLFHNELTNFKRCMHVSGIQNWTSYSHFFALSKILKLWFLQEMTKFLARFGLCDEHQEEKESVFMLD